MTSFTLHKDKCNVRIAKAIKEENKDYVQINTENEELHISFQAGLTIIRSAIEDALKKEISDEEWKALAYEIKKTLSGGKIREFNKNIIGISPLKTERIFIRLDPLEKTFITEAAKQEGRTISDFVRLAAIERARDVFAEETVRRMKEEAREEERKTRTYVS